MQRTRWLVASALILATLGAGAALRVYGMGPAPVPPAPPTAVHFTGPGTGPVTFRGNLDRTAVLRGGDGLVRMELLIGGAEGEGAAPSRAPTDLVVVLDRSGSMGGTKIEHARAAIRELVEKLGPRDRFALVAYANHAQLAVPLAAAEGDAPSRWLRLVDALHPGGGTNLAVGLDLATDTIERSRVAGRVSRAILISDGLANQGDTSSQGLIGRAARAARGEYVLSAVGVGEDFNEQLMSALADAGTGNYYYLESALGLGEVFAGEFDAARATVASGLAVRIEPRAGVEVVEAGGYPLDRSGSAVVFRPGAVFSGQERHIWVTLRVPHAAPGSYPLGGFSLSYADGPERTTLRFGETPVVACVEDPDRFVASIDRRGWETSVIDEVYGALQQEVGSYVREGRREEALRAIESFERENGELNERLQSPAVAEQLREADALRDRVEQAFSGDDQAQRRNRLSKRMSEAAVDQRRTGNKR